MNKEGTASHLEQKGVQ